MTFHTRTFGKIDSSHKFIGSIDTLYKAFGQMTFH